MMQTWNQNSNYIPFDRKQSIVELLTKSATASSKVPVGSSSLTNTELLSFIRKLEKIVTEAENLRNNVALIYWSANDASWLLPNRADMNILNQTAIACSALSEHRNGQEEEFCFIVWGKELCATVYGHSAELNGRAVANQYECAISFDSMAVKKVYDALSPYWDFIDPQEADKASNAIAKLSAASTPPHVAHALSKDWTNIKTPPKVVEAKPAAVVVPQPEEPQISVKIAEEDIIETQGAKADWQQRIASEYPYPIANPYRTLECITDVSEKYKEQLRLVENLLALLAGLSLSITAQTDPSIISVLKASLSTGISVGHWRELIRKCSLIWRESPIKEIPLAKSMLDLRVEQVERGFGKAIEQLVRARNDFAHHRGPTAESQIEKETIRLAELLDVAIEQTLFLCDHPLRIVRAIDVMPTGTIKMTCLKATGDHPALRQEQVRLNRGFPKGQMIINAGNSNWISLYPFISQDICSKCGSMEIYLTDKWRFDKNIVNLRSFERGHTLESKAISDALKTMGKL